MKGSGNTAPLFVCKTKRACLTWTDEMVYSQNKPTRGGMNMQGYCVKCRAKREIKDARAITMKNGKPATQGICPVCGTKMFRIGKS